MLIPETHRDRQTLYTLLRDELKRHIVGQDLILQRLAIAGVRHLSGDGMVRAVLIGPTGSGKSTILRTLVRTLDLPWVECSIALMSEEGWRGVDLSGHLDVLHRKARERADNPLAGRFLAQRGIVILDELDKLRIHPTEEGPSRSQHLGKQQSVLGLWDGGTFSVDGTGPPLEWHASRTMVLGCGVFDGLDARVPSSGDFSEWGLMPELAGRICRGSVLQLEPLRQEELELVLMLGLDDIDAAFASFGYRLAVTDAALSMVAAILQTGEHDAHARAGIGWLVNACERALARLLEEEAPVGTRFTLSPDAVTIPDPPQSRWWDS